MTTGRICALILAILLLVFACCCFHAASAVTPRDVDWETAKESESLPGGAVLAYLALSWTSMIAGLGGFMLWFPALLIFSVLAYRTRGKWRIAMGILIAITVLSPALLL